MSYCRWSSDDFRCDVYVYHSHAGYETHVASSRHTLTDAELPAPVDLPDGFTPEQFRAWWERGRQVMGLLDTAEYEPLNLPCDGERFLDMTPEACADRLERLRGLGYHVPQYAIDALREEQAVLS